MGMFDSFIADYKGTTHEIQTKRFENVLDVWKVGDVINQPSFGVQVLYELAEEVNSRLEYAFPEDANIIIYLVIANGVYVENITTPYSNDTDVAETINELENKWQDTNRQITTFNTHLNAKQNLNKIYLDKLNLLAGYINEFRNPEPDALGLSKLHFPKLEKINSDSDLVNVLLEELIEVLSVHTKPIEVIYDDDPLARYRA